MIALRRLLLFLLLASPLLAVDQPNVLFVAIDDLNDYISILGGHPQAKTPNLDRLARLGLTFTNAHTASPVCNSSRCAVMTGRHPFETGIYGNGQPARATITRFGSLNREFLNAGYYTAGSGKIYHTNLYIEADWSETKARFPWPELAPKRLMKIGGQFDTAGAYPDELEAQTGDALTVDWVAERLRSPRTTPFFLACGIFRPHTVWQVPQKYYDLFPEDSIILPEVKADDLADIPVMGRRLALFKEGYGEVTDPADPRSHPHADIVKAGHWKRAVRAYLACIAYADAQLGRLLDAYETSPHRANTILVLWSDHGWHLGEKLHWRKATLWEEATRVPLIIVAPGLTQPGTTCDRVVSLIDLYPTLRDLCTLPGKTPLSGQSLRPLLRNPAATGTRNYALTTYLEGAIAVRTPDARYIRYPDGQEEFYDRRADPHEWTNLAANPSAAERMTALKKLLPATMVPGSTPRAARDDE